MVVRVLNKTAKPLPLPPGGGWGEGAWGRALKVDGKT